MIFRFFKQKHECHHNNVPPDAEEAYCPDCGELVSNKWYLIRCACCNIKRHARIRYNSIKPNTKFCPNCGSSGFYIQKTDKISFIDVQYAVLLKETVKRPDFETCSIWIEKDEISSGERKLIGIKP